MSVEAAKPVHSSAVRDVAIVLFAEQGYRGTTMNEIAERLGIRGPSLYKHVSSKHEILADIVVSTMEMLLDHQREAIARERTPVAQLRESVRALVIDHVENPQRVQVCHRELASLDRASRDLVADQRDRLWRATRAVVDAGVADGSFRVDSVTISTFCVVDLAGSPADWFEAGRSTSGAEVADQVAQMALRMVGCLS